MKKHIALISALTFSAPSIGTPLYHPSGSNLTYGAISNIQNIMSDITNPAAGAAVFTINEGQIRFGVLSSVGAGYEIADVVDLVTEVDSTIKFFINRVNTDNYPDKIRPVDPGLTTSQNVANVLADVNALILETNGLMANLQTDGYFKGFASIHAPIMPLIVSHKAFSGSFVVDFNASNVALATFLSEDIDPLILTTAIQLQVQAAEGGAKLDLGDVITSDTAVVIKSSVISELSLGYSISKWQSNDGQLFAGIRANFYKVELGRTTQLFNSANNETSLRTIYDDNQDSFHNHSTGFGIDLGVLWVSERYRIGTTIKNINAPGFDYNPFDIGEYTDPSIISELQKGEKYEMAPQLRLESALFSANQNWVFGVALDTNAITDPVGQQFQWATTSAAYATNSWSIPGFRLGYRANLAGTELSYLTTGLTLLKVFNLDIAYGLEKVRIEKNNLTSVNGNRPRSIIVNVGLEITF